MPEIRSPANRNPAPEPPEEGLARAFMAIPKTAHIPGLILLAAIWAAWLLHAPGDMRDWGLSAAALAQGHTANIVLHAFAHAGLLHIGFNSVVLASLAGPLLTWMGRFPQSWLRFFGIYAASGLAGAGLYLVLNPSGNVPMVGASGAISGLIGLASRLSEEHDGLVPLFSREMARRLWHFIKANLWLVLLFSIPIILGGGGGGIAWEAHLGGFLAGLVGARLVLVDSRA